MSAAVIKVLKIVSSTGMFWAVLATSFSADARERCCFTWSLQHVIDDVRCSLLHSLVVSCSCLLSLLLSLVVPLLALVLLVYVVKFAVVCRVAGGNNGSTLNEGTPHVTAAGCTKRDGLDVDAGILSSARPSTEAVAERLSKFSSLVLSWAAAVDVRTDPADLI